MTGWSRRRFGIGPSRARDPQLHTHVVIANTTRCGADGVWRALDGRHLYAHAEVAGYLYQAELHERLSARLGIEWGAVAHGCADLVAAPVEVLEEFSRRAARSPTPPELSVTTRSGRGDGSRSRPVASRTHGSIRRVWRLIGATEPGCTGWTRRRSQPGPTRTRVCPRLAHRSARSRRRHSRTPVDRARDDLRQARRTHPTRPTRSGRCDDRRARSTRRAVPRRSSGCRRGCPLTGVRYTSVELLTVEQTSSRTLKLAAMSALRSATRRIARRLLALE